MQTRARTHKRNKPQQYCVFRTSTATHIRCQMRENIFRTPKVFSLYSVYYAARWPIIFIKGRRDVRKIGRRIFKSDFNEA